MTHFANMVEDAYYDDASYSTVTIEYKDHEGVLRSHNVAADRDNTDFAFLQDSEGYDDALLIKRTEVHKRSMSRTFNASIERAAKDLAEVMAEKMVEERVRVIASGLEDKFQKEHKKVESAFAEQAKRYTHNLEIEGIEPTNLLAVLKHNEDKDSLFQFKLWALELDEVKSADSDIKKSLRKQTSILGTMQILNDLINN